MLFRSDHRQSGSNPRAFRVGTEKRRYLLLGSRFVASPQVDQHDLKSFVTVSLCPLRINGQQSELSTNQSDDKDLRTGLGNDPY